MTTIECCPVDDYRVEFSSRISNVAFIKPPVGKSFTLDQKRQLVLWLRSLGYSVVFQEGKAIRVYDGQSARLDDIPFSQKERDRNEQKRQDALKQEALCRQREEQRQSEFARIKATPAYKYVESLLGDAANEYNKVKLARFVSGEDSKFQGLAASAWCERLDQAKIEYRALSVSDVVENIKAHFQRCQVAQVAVPNLA